jgi:hypothetical protein
VHGVNQIAATHAPSYHDRFFDKVALFQHSRPHFVIPEGNLQSVVGYADNTMPGNLDPNRIEVLKPNSLLLLPSTQEKPLQLKPPTYHAC